MSIPDSDQPSLNRRSFLKTGSTLAAATVVASPSVQASTRTPSSLTEFTRPEQPTEWRNQQPGMHYRKLGATGMMVSEMVMGGIPINQENRNMVKVAMELGVNYIDTATGYGRGESETALGLLFKENPGMRDQLFLASKLSQFGGYRRSLYQDLFKTLPSEKQEAIEKRARAIVQERGVGQPGVFYRYFPNQDRELDWEYRIIAMQESYGHRIDGNGRFRKRMMDILDESLSRTGVDYYDVLFCPHGASSSNQLDEPEMLDTLAEIKKSGRARSIAVSTHTAYHQVMRKATDLPVYDVIMATYNVINQGAAEEAITYAYEQGVGLIAMKAAAAVRTHFDAFKPLPAWREQKLQTAVPGDFSVPVKAYIWVLQNPNVAAVISNMWNEDMIRENTTAVGKQVELQRV